jgi:chorismate lyase
MPKEPMPEDHARRCEPDPFHGICGGDDAAVQPVWRAGDGLGPDRLHPAWRLFLLGDGSATRNMALLTGGPIQVEVTEVRELMSVPDPAPGGIGAIPGPWLFRRVWLTAADGTALSHAVSWWHRPKARECLEDPAQPVGSNLARARRAFHREILSLFRIESPLLADRFGHPGPCWGRHYRMWDRGEAVCLIGEIYSPVIGRHLGIGGANG